MIVAIAHALFTVLVGAALACALWRVWRGPTVADRINAADVVALCCVGLAVGHGWRRGDGVWLDVAMVAGLVLFVGTVAVALRLDPRHLAGEDEIRESEAGEGLTPIPGATEERGGKAP
jgi:multisubunit Na+/H+ antiporter MnhF subunit